MSGWEITGLNILLLLENPEACKMAGFALEAQLGAEVFRADSMQAAFDHLLDERPVDLLIIDDVAIRRPR